MNKTPNTKRKWLSDDEAQKIFEISIVDAAKEHGLKNPLLSKQRYRIMGDESGHDYFIPVEQEEQFRLWVESGEYDFKGKYVGPDFDENRIDGRFTFTDPRNEN